MQNADHDINPARLVAEMKEAGADFTKNMAAAKDGWEALAVVGKTLVSNPGFVAYNVASEILQEGTQLLASGGVLTAARLVGAAPRIAQALGIATEVVLDMMESGGGAAESGQGSGGEFSTRLGGAGSGGGGAGGRRCADDGRPRFL